MDYETVYETKNLSKKQQKVTQKFINSVMDGFQSDITPSYIIKIPDSDKRIKELESQKSLKDEKEIKEIDKQIKGHKNYAKNHIKVVFTFINNPKKLVCLYDIMFTERIFAPRYTWAGMLDFPIANSFLFGRVCETVKHGGGDYYFAPGKAEWTDLVEKLDKKEHKAPEIFIESEMLLFLLNRIKFTQESIELLKQMPEIINSNLNTIPLVDKLNQNKELINSMKKIPHFGTTTYGLNFASEIDVSTIFIPYKDITYFHIDQFTYAPKKHYRYIKDLLYTLELKS